MFMTTNEKGKYSSIKFLFKTLFERVESPRGMILIYALIICLIRPLEI